jgi:G3E family GTPase
VTAVLPAVIVGGYLGAGKTTLVNHLLRHAGGRRIAVMVNDFGAIDIDADLIESRDDEVIGIAGGCVCCSVGSDLIGALVGLPERTPPPELVLIETSGVALPGSVARSVRLAAGIEVDAVVVLADAETIRARAGDPYVGDIVLRQLADADLLVLNKVDLVAPAGLPALRDWLDAVAPRARRIEAVEARVAVDVLLGSADGGDPSPRVADVLGARHTDPDGAPLRRPSNAADVFESAGFRLDVPVDPAALAAALADPSLGLVRAKGIVVAPDGTTVVVQVVGPRTRVSPVAEGAGAALAGRLVAIGLRGRFDPAAVRAAIAASSPERQSGKAAKR